MIHYKKSSNGLKNKKYLFIFLLLFFVLHFKIAIGSPEGDWKIAGQSSSFGGVDHNPTAICPDNTYDYLDLDPTECENSGGMCVCANNKGPKNRSTYYGYEIMENVSCYKSKMIYPLLESSHFYCYKKRPACTTKICVADPGTVCEGDLPIFGYCPSSQGKTTFCCQVKGQTGGELNNSDNGKKTISLEIPLFGKKTVEDLPDYIKFIYQNFAYLLGVLSVIMIVFSGFQWVSAGGNESKISEAKERLKNIITGLAIGSCSYLLLFIINRDLVTFKAFIIDPIKPEAIINYDPVAYGNEVIRDMLADIKCQKNQDCKSYSKEQDPKVCRPSTNTIKDYHTCQSRGRDNNSCDPEDQVADCLPGLTCDSSGQCVISPLFRCKEFNSVGFDLMSGIRCFSQMYGREADKVVSKAGFCSSRKSSDNTYECVECRKIAQVCDNVKGDDDYMCDNGGLCGRIDVFANSRDAGVKAMWNSLPNNLRTDNKGNCVYIGLAWLPLFGGGVDGNNNRCCPLGMGDAKCKDIVLEKQASGEVKE